MRCPVLIIVCILWTACQPPSTNVVIPEIQTKTDTSKVVKRVISAGPEYQPSDTCAGGIALFDRTGKKLEEYDYSSCGELFKRVVFHYEGDQIVMSNIYCELENVVYDWRYDQNGLLVGKQAQAVTRVFPYLVDFEYDDEGQLIATTSTMHNGDWFNGTCRKEFEYADGLKVATQCYFGDNCNEKGYRLIHLYDENRVEIGGRTYKDPESLEYGEGVVYYEYW